MLKNGPPDEARGAGGRWTATSVHDSKGKAKLTVSGPEGQRLSETGTRAARYSHIVVFRHKPEHVEGVLQNGTTFHQTHGYVGAGRIDLAEKAAKQWSTYAGGDVKIIPVEHVDG